MQAAVEDGIGHGRIGDHLMPVLDGHLAGEDGGAAIVPVIVELARSAGTGLAVANVERVRAGAEWLEVRRFQISQTGCQALGKG